MKCPERSGMMDTRFYVQMIQEEEDTISKLIAFIKAQKNARNLRFKWTDNTSATWFNLPPWVREELSKKGENA